MRQLGLPLPPAKHGGAQAPGVQQAGRDLGQMAALLRHDGQDVVDGEWEGTHQCRVRLGWKSWGAGGDSGEPKGFTPRSLASRIWRHLDIGEAGSDVVGGSSDPSLGIWKRRRGGQKGGNQSQTMERKPFRSLPPGSVARAAQRRLRVRMCRCLWPGGCQGWPSSGKVYSMLAGSETLQ